MLQQTPPNHIHLSGRVCLPHLGEIRRLRERCGCPKISCCMPIARSPLPVCPHLHSPAWSETTPGAGLRQAICSPALAAARLSACASVTNRVSDTFRSPPNRRTDLSTSIALRGCSPALAPGASVARGGCCFFGRTNQLDQKAAFHQPCSLGRTDSKSRNENGQPSQRV